MSIINNRSVTVGVAGHMLILGCILTPLSLITQFVFSFIAKIKYFYSQYTFNN